MLQTAHPDRACSGAMRGPAHWNRFPRLALLRAPAQAPPLATVSRPSSPLDVPERDPSRKPERPECRSPGAFHFWSARDRKPNKKTHFFSTSWRLSPAQIAGMWRVVQQVKCALLRGTYRLEGGFGFSACHRPPRRLRGKELWKRSLAVLRPRPPVRVHPPPGRGGIGASNGVWPRVLRKSCRFWEAKVGP
jgi:hypothetical protein